MNRIDIGNLYLSRINYKNCIVNRALVTCENINLASKRSTIVRQVFANSTSQTGIVEDVL